MCIRDSRTPIQLWQCAGYIFSWEMSLTSEQAIVLSISKFCACILCYYLSIIIMCEYIIIAYTVADYRTEQQDYLALCLPWALHPAWLPLCTFLHAIFGPPLQCSLWNIVLFEWYTSPMTWRVSAGILNKQCLARWRVGVPKGCLIAVSYTHLRVPM